MYRGPRVKYSLLFQISREIEFSLIDFQNIFKYKISSKSVQWEVSCCMRTDGRTDRHTYLMQYCESA